MKHIYLKAIYTYVWAVKLSATLSLKHILHDDA